LETFFPIVGKPAKIFSNHWKIRPDFSNHWKLFFQSLENFSTHWKTSFRASRIDGAETACSESPPRLFGSQNKGHAISWRGFGNSVGRIVGGGQRIMRGLLGERAACLGVLLARAGCPCSQGAERRRGFSWKGGEGKTRKKSMFFMFSKAVRGRA
jgi:hypothetical protein